MSDEARQIISKLKQDRRSLIARLNILNSENEPTIEPRKQRYLERSIKTIKARLADLNKEIKIYREEIDNFDNQEIANISEKVKDLSIEVTTAESEHRRRLSSLENFINFSQKNMFNTPPHSVNSEQPQTSPIGNTFSTGDDFEHGAVGGITTSASDYSSTPRPPAQSITKTTTTHNKPTFSFEEFHSEQRARKDNEFNILYENEARSNNIYTGTIPKRSNLPRISEEETINNDFILNQNLNTHNKKYDENKKLNENQMPNYDNISRDEIGFEGIPKRFMNYNPTPQRITDNNNQNNRRISDESNLQQNMNIFPHQNSNYNQNFDLPQQRRVNFNIPQNSEQNFVYDQNAPRKSYIRRLTTIPKFSGDTYQELRDFIDISEALYYSCVNQAEENEFFDQMTLQLRGEARNLILKMNSPNWEQIKAALLKYFAFLSNKDVLISQIENLHQEKDETLTKYAERARKLLKEKNMTYNFLTEEQRSEHNRQARRAFAKGVSNTRLSEKLLIRGGASLEDTIAYALEAENDAITQIAKRELFCGYCRLNGHRENECRDKSNKENGLNGLISALRSLGNQNRNNFRQNRFNSNLNVRDRNFFLNNNDPFNRNWNRRFNNNRNWISNDNWNNNNANWNNPNWNNRNFNRNFNNNNNFYDGNQGRNWSNPQNNNPNRNNMQQNGRQQQKQNNFARNSRIEFIDNDNIISDDILDINETEN